jgi:hypothetical protein
LKLACQVLVADPGPAELVDVVEVVEEVLEVGVPVGPGGRDEPVEDALVHALGVVAGLEKERRYRAEQHHVADQFRAVAPQVAGDLAGAHREPGQGHVAQVKHVHEPAKVGGERVVVIADGRLAGGAEAAAVIGDDPVAGVQQRRELLLPGVAVQRVAVDQHHRPSAAVVLVVDLDPAGVSSPTLTYGMSFPPPCAVCDAAADGLTPVAGRLKPGPAAEGPGGRRRPG